MAKTLSLENFCLFISEQVSKLKCTLFCKRGAQSGRVETLQYEAFILVESYPCDLSLSIGTITRVFGNKPIFSACPSMLFRRFWMVLVRRVLTSRFFDVYPFYLCLCLSLSLKEIRHYCHHSCWHCKFIIVLFLELLL